MSDFMLDELFAGFDDPVRPRPEFEASLRALLLDELNATGELAGRRTGRALRRRVLLVAAVVAAFAVAVAAAALLLQLLGGGAAPSSTTPATASRLAEREPVRIDLSGGPVGGNPYGGSGSFTLRLGTTSDAGGAAYSVTFPSSRTTPDGQEAARFAATITLVGRRGQLVVRATGRATGVVGTGANDGEDVWQGSWRVVEGTGRYAGLQGGGMAVGIAGPGALLTLRLDGALG